MKHGEVRDRLLAVKGVKSVHNLHIWTLTMNQTVLSAHVAIGECSWTRLSVIYCYVATPICNDDDGFIVSTTLFVLLVMHPRMKHPVEMPLLFPLYVCTACDLT